MATAGAGKQGSRSRKGQKDVTITVGRSGAKTSSGQRQLSPRFEHHNRPRDNTRQGITSSGWEYRAEAAQTFKNK